MPSPRSTSTAYRPHCKSNKAAPPPHQTSAMPLATSPRSNRSRRRHRPQPQPKPAATSRASHRCADLTRRPPSEATLSRTSNNAASPKRASWPPPTCDDAIVGVMAAANCFADQGMCPVAGIDAQQMLGVFERSRDAELLAEALRLLYPVFTMGAEDIQHLVDNSGLNRRLTWRCVEAADRG